MILSKFCPSAKVKEASTYAPRPKRGEHLMLVFYDVLLLDQRSLLNARHSERFKVLESIVQPRRGWAQLVTRQIINFGHRMAASNLRKEFAMAIVNKEEGLVVKPDEPYFDFDASQQPWCGRCIKMKKEYIGSFGDVGDFAVVGAGYDSIKARDYNIPNLKWTHFYIGCLNNKEEVTRWSATPDFTIVNVVSLNEAQLCSIAKYAMPTWVSRAEECCMTFKLVPNIEKGPCMSMFFLKPLVFDLRCFSFDKTGNTGFWSLRFPAVSKIHFERDFTDTISFEELQDMAKTAHDVPEQPDSQENLRWIAKLEGADPRSVAVDRTSQQTGTTEPTPSPRRSHSSPPKSYPKSPDHVQSITQEVGKQSSRLFSSQTDAGFDDIETAVPCVATTSATVERLATVNRCTEPYKRSKPRAEEPRANKKPKRSNRDFEPSGPSLPPAIVSQGRRPLASIDANSSQQSATRASQRFSPPVPFPANPAQVVDLVSSPISSLEEATSLFELSPAQGIPSSQTEITVKLSDESKIDGDPAFNKIPDAASEMPSSKKGDTRSISLSACASSQNCVYAGAHCQFIDKTVILAPQLAKDRDLLEPHLVAHGITNQVTNLEDWIISGMDVRAPFLLVDSMNHKSEMEHLVEKIKNYHKSVSGEWDNFVTVYDWRVLKNITTMEDQNLTKKYYDGFKDPWRRWYCGLV